MKYAEIIINSNAKDLNRTFDYIIGDEIENEVKIGTRVLVPFGNSKSPKLEEGFVIGIKSESEFAKKSIAKVEKGEIDPKKIELAKWISKRYFSNTSDAIKLMLQPGTSSKNEKDRTKERLVNCVRLVNKDFKDVKTEKQLKVLKILKDNGEFFVSDIVNLEICSLAVLKTLEKNGYVEIFKKEAPRNPFINKDIKKTKKLKLNDEQQNALDEIDEAIESGFYSRFLIYGVTGAGKTEIYLQAIDKVLKKGKSSIMLVPEISLTPQTVNRFVSRFGEDKVAILHSKLSVGERFDEWNRIERGEAKIVIGARSAIFAPVKDLGIIIIDEEHDSSYKSEMSPRYNAIEIAEYMTKEENIPLVLGSATPSMNSFYKATKKSTDKYLSEEDKEFKLESSVSDEYSLSVLKNRANSAVLPNVKILDMRDELANGNRSMLSQELHDEIEKNIKDKHQTILFLNRRGYSTFVMCRDCGYTKKCPNCNITLTYHMSGNRLKCHYCGHEENPISVCPKCGSKKVKYFGTGTQKLEDLIKKEFPNASTIRMDIDTVTKKNSHERILDKFRNDNIDILIGTQMVVKGHDFPNVTLVGVIAADSLLGLNDFRASERTFQLLTQVAGRAGRSKELPGKVIIQTYNPDEMAIKLAAKQDYEKFYETEIKLRKVLKYPPFCDIIMIGISGKDESLVIKKAQEIHAYLKYRVINEKFGLLLYSPVSSPINRIQGRFRWRIIIKCLYDDRVNNLILDAFKECTSGKDETRVIADVNPTNMM